MSKSPKLLLPNEYIDDATKLINQAKYKVSLLTMILTENPDTKALLEALIAAADRGVSVNLAADTYTYTEPHKASRARDRLSDAKKMQRRLEKASIKFRWLGRANVFVGSGRTHSKWCVIDDTVYSFGGVNLDDDGLERTDFMLKLQDSSLADSFHAEQQRIIRADRSGHPYRSHLFGYEDDTVLIDGGLIGDSIIYRRACNLARQSKEILLVSQYCPTGRLSRLIKTVDKADLYFNHWTNAGLLNRFIIRAGMLLSKHSTAYHHRRYLHAKFIVFTLRDGSKVAITGSHNFVMGGVWLGTREVALETSDAHVIKQLERFHRQNLA